MPQEKHEWAGAEHLEEVAIIKRLHNGPCGPSSRTLRDGDVGNVPRSENPIKSKERTRPPP